MHGRGGMNVRFSYLLCWYKLKLLILQEEFNSADIMRIHNNRRNRKEPRAGTFSVQMIGIGIFQGISGKSNSYD
jgi:hypothetical protein